MMWRIWDYDEEQFDYCNTNDVFGRFSGDRYLLMAWAGIESRDGATVWTGDAVFDDAGNIYLARPNGLLLDARMALWEPRTVGVISRNANAVVAMTKAERSTLGVPDRWVIDREALSLDKSALPLQVIGRASVAFGMR